MNGCLDGVELPGKEVVRWRGSEVVSWSNVGWRSPVHNLTTSPPHDLRSSGRRLTLRNTLPPFRDGSVSLNLRIAGSVASRALAPSGSSWAKRQAANSRSPIRSAQSRKQHIISRRIASPSLADAVKQKHGLICLTFQITKLRLQLFVHLSVEFGAARGSILAEQERPPVATPAIGHLQARPRRAARRQGRRRPRPPMPWRWECQYPRPPRSPKRRVCSAWRSGSLDSSGPRRSPADVPASPVVLAVWPSSARDSLARASSAPLSCSPKSVRRSMARHRSSRRDSTCAVTCPETTPSCTV